MSRFVVVVVLLAACGGDDGGSAAADARSIDGTSATVQMVTCPTTADAMVTSTNATSSFMPMTQTVPKNAVVKFVMPSMHDVAPNPIGATDPGLVVGFGETKCLKFTASGTFGFYCSAHSFAGTITVQ